MDPANDLYYRWLTVIAAPVFYNLMMLVTRYSLFHTDLYSFNCTVRTKQSNASPFLDFIGPA